MYNKNMVKKTQDRKVLHKVGKQWKVISLALLLALGGTAVATHVSANANADTNANTDANTNSSTLAQDGINENGIGNKEKGAINALVASNAVGPNYREANPNVKLRAQRTSSNVIHYWDNNAGSAASYHAKADNDASQVDSTAQVVNSYVSSMQQQAPKTTHSLAENYLSLSSKAYSASGRAANYSNIANDQNDSGIVESLARDKKLYPSDFANSVISQDSTDHINISNFSKQASELGIAASYATLISGIRSDPQMKMVFENRLASDQINYMQASLEDNNYKAIYQGTANNFLSANKALDSISAEIANNNNGSALANANSKSDSVVMASVAENDLGNIPITTANSEAVSLGDSLTADDNATTPFNFVNSDGAVEQLSGQDIYTLISDYANRENYNSNSNAYANSLGEIESKVANYSGVNSNFNEEMSSANSLLSSTAHNYYVDSTLAANPSLTEIFGTNESANINALNSDANSAGDSENDAEGAINSLNTDVASLTAKLYQGTDTAFNTDMTDYLGSLNAKNETVTSDGLVNAIEKQFGGLGTITGNANFASLADQLAGDDIVDGNVGNYTFGSDAQSDAQDDIDVWMNAYAQSSNASVSNDIDGIENDEATIESLSDRVNSDSSKAAYLTTKGASNALMSDNSAAAQIAIGDWVNDSNVSEATSKINSLASSASADESSAVQDLNQFMSGSDATYVLAPSLYAKYSSEATSDSVLASNAKNSMEDYYLSTADSPVFTKAFNTYKSASTAYVVNSDYAQAYGINVWNRAPKVIRVVHNCILHTSVEYRSKNDVKVEKLHKGQVLKVTAMGLARDGALRYLVKDHKGHEGYVTALRNYVRPAYLLAQDNTSVVVTKAARIYNDPRFKNRTHKTVRPGQVLNGVNILRRTQWNDGFTVIELPNGKFITANTRYMKPVDSSNNTYYYGRKRGKTLGYGFSEAGHRTTTNTSNKRQNTINWID